MKVLTTRKVNLAICWSGLRGVAPKDFPSVNELDQTSTILGKLKEAVKEFVGIIEEGEKLNTELMTGKVKGDEIEKRKKEYLKNSATVESENDKEVVSVEFEPDTFNTFFQQFERWGKNWFVKIETYLEFRKDMCDCNKQPK